MPPEFNSESGEDYCDDRDALIPIEQHSIGVCKSHLLDDVEQNVYGYNLQYRDSIVYSSCIDFMSIAGGVSILSLPNVFQSCGVLVATVQIIFFSLVIIWCHSLLYASAEGVNTNSSHSKLAKKCFGRWSELFMTLQVLLFLIFVQVASMILIRGYWWTILFEEMNDGEINTDTINQSRDHIDSVLDDHNSFFTTIQENEDNLLLLGFILAIGFIMMCFKETGRIGSVLGQSITKKTLYRMEIRIWIDFLTILTSGMILYIVIGRCYHYYDNFRSIGCEVKTQMIYHRSESVEWFNFDIYKILNGMYTIIIAVWSNFHLILSKMTSRSKHKLTRRIVQKLSLKAMCINIYFTIGLGIAGYLLDLDFTKGLSLSETNFLLSAIRSIFNQITGIILLVGINRTFYQSRGQLVTMFEQYRHMTHLSSHDKQAHEEQISTREHDGQQGCDVFDFDEAYHDQSFDMNPEFHQHDTIGIISYSSIKNYDCIKIDGEETTTKEECSLSTSPSSAGSGNTLSSSQTIAHRPLHTVLRCIERCSPFLVTILCYTIACVTRSVDVIWFVCGYSVGFSIAVLFPALCYVKVYYSNR